MIPVPGPARSRTDLALKERNPAARNGAAVRNLQSIGRGLRLGDNKVNATLYDISDDLTHKSKENYTLKHFQERINIYNEEEFDYEIHNINLKD